MPEFLQDLALEPTPAIQDDDLLLLHSMHEPVGPDRKVVVGNFQMTRNGRMTGGGTLTVNGFTVNFDHNGNAVTRLEMQRLLGATAPGHVGTGLDINGVLNLQGHNNTSHRNGVLATLNDLNEGIGRIETTMNSLTTELRGWEQQVRDLQALERSVESRVANIKSQLDNLPDATAIEAHLEAEIQNLIARITAEEATAAALDSELKSLEALLNALKTGGAGAPDLSAITKALDDIRAGVASEATRATRTSDAVTNIQNMITTHGLKGFIIEDHPDASGLYDAIIQGENLFVTKEDIHSTGLEHFVRLNFRTGLHIQNLSNFANLGAGQLHLHATPPLVAEQDFFVHHVPDTAGTYPGGGWLVDANDKIWFEWEDHGTHRVTIGDIDKRIVTNKQSMDAVYPILASLNAEAAKIAPLAARVVTAQGTASQALNLGGTNLNKITANTAKFGNYYTKTESNSRFWRPNTPLVTSQMIQGNAGIIGNTVTSNGQVYGQTVVAKNEVSAGNFQLKEGARFGRIFWTRLVAATWVTLPDKASGTNAELFVMTNRGPYWGVLRDTRAKSLSTNNPVGVPPARIEARLDAARKPMLRTTWTTNAMVMVM